MAVGLVLFWPALFFLEGGDGPEAAEYACLKGEVDALEQVAIQKKCDMTMFAALDEQEAQALDELKRSSNKNAIQRRITVPKVAGRHNLARRR
jgi:hypothetical protein